MIGRKFYYCSKSSLLQSRYLILNHSKPQQQRQRIVALSLSSSPSKNIFPTTETELSTTNKSRKCLSYNNSTNTLFNDKSHYLTWSYSTNRYFSNAILDSSNNNNKLHSSTSRTFKTVGDAAKESNTNKNKNWNNEIKEFNNNKLMQPKDLLNEDIRKLLHTLRHTKNDIERNEALVQLSQQSNSNVTTDDSIGLLTLCGSKGNGNDINQDAGFIISPYNMSNDTATVTVSNNVLMGVMDGHGTKGELVSSYMIQQLPYTLYDNISKGNNHDDESIIKQSIKKTFNDIDINTKHMTGGCSASIIFKYNDKMYIANAGDSRSIIAKYNKHDKDNIEIMYASREDKPSLPEETKRIESSGGKVYIPKRKDETCRVLYTDPKTGGTTGLAMSRSIGDWDAKRVGVISEPIIDVVSLDNINEHDKLFGISITDGMLDYISLESIATRVAYSLYYDDNSAINTASSTDDDANKNNYDHPLLAAEELALTAAMGWTKSYGNRYRDDITIVFTDLSSNNTNK